MRIRTKQKGVMIAVVFALMCLLATVCFFGRPASASAATYTTPKYLTYGTTSMNGSTSSGCPSNFRVYMHGSGTNGTSTMYNGALTDWSYYYITVEASKVDDHIGFKLYRNGSTYISKSLGGKSSMTLYSGTLPDGDYELEYACRYRTNIFTSYKNFVYRYRFEVDNSAPTYSLRAGGSAISSGTYTNKAITYTAYDANFDRIRYLRPSASSYASSYGTTYSVSAQASNNGWWYFYAADALGASNRTVSVYLDTVAPVGKVLTEQGTTISNGAYTNKKIKYSATDAGGVSYLQYKTPTSSAWQSYTANTVVGSSYGQYTFRAVDKAGNISSEYRVYYDAGLPTGTLYAESVTKSGGSYVNASYISYTASDAYSGIANCYVRMPNTSYYTTYASGTRLTAEGTYYFYTVDRSGNASSTMSITLDRTKPTGTLYGGATPLTSGSYTNTPYIKFVPYDALGLSATYVKKPNTSAYVSYASGAQLSEEGTYSFYCVDRAGNISQTYTVTLDRHIPVAQLYVDEVPFGNNGYTNGAHIKFECAEKCYVKLPGSNAFTDYMSGVEYHKPGKYVFYGITEAGSSSGYFSVVIDRTTKTLQTVNVTNGVTDGDVTLAWTDGDANVFAPIRSVEINGKPYRKGETIHTIDTGVYNVHVTDAAGNTWETSFSSVKQNVLTQTLQQKYYEAYDADNTMFAFATYESALKFAAAREESYVRTGEWHSTVWDTGMAMDYRDSANAANGTFFIYKRSGRPDEEVAYFTRERLNEVIAEYAADGIESYYYWEKEPAAIADGENLFSYSDDKHILAKSVTVGENVGCKLDGEEIVERIIETEGEHVLTVFDEWGNTCDYDLSVIRRVPDVCYKLGNGNNNTVLFDRTYRFYGEVTVSLFDRYDESAMFCVFDENGKRLGYFGAKDTFVLTESGTYTVEAVNRFGKSEVFAFDISRNAPKVSLRENTANKRLEVFVTPSTDELAHLDALEIYKSVDGGKSWELLGKDDYGNIISAETLSYAFCTSGLYKAVAFDEFRTGIDAVEAEYDYTQAAPEVTISGVENGGYTNDSVIFTWTDEATVTLERDGEQLEYKSGEEITADGTYTLTVENRDGYKKEYTFVIDTVAPEVTLGGARNHGAVTGEVKVSFTDENATAELFRNGISLGTYESVTVVSESGAYKIVVTDLANNKTEVEFTIDKFVDYTVNVNEKGIAGSVTVTANEDVTARLIKDGETVEYTVGESITEAGEYALTLTDGVGNTAEISFTVIKPLVKAFSYNFDEMPNFERVVIDGEEKRLNYGTLELFKDGVYEVGVVVGGETYTFTVTVDGTAPTLTLGGVENGGTTKKGVTLSDLSENADVKVYLGGTETAYGIGDTLTKAGQYKVTVTDKCGNVTEYTFRIQKGLSGGIIALIVIGSVLLVGGAVTVLVLKKKNVF